MRQSVIFACSCSGTKIVHDAFRNRIFFRIFNGHTRAMSFDANCLSDHSGEGLLATDWLNNWFDEFTELGRRGLPQQLNTMVARRWRGSTDGLRIPGRN